jgi:hypothetical protein
MAYLGAFMRRQENNVMKFEIPEPLRHEHAFLRVQLAKAVQEPGTLGEAARDLARLMHPHLAREEEFALPPLALLTRVAVGVVTPEMAEVLPIAKRLKAELGRLLEEHQAIAAAAERLNEVARAAGNTQYETFLRTLFMHTQNEEQIHYPAAILVGAIVKQALL